MQATLPRRTLVAIEYQLRHAVGNIDHRPVGHVRPLVELDLRLHVFARHSACLQGLSRDRMLFE